MFGPKIDNEAYRSKGLGNLARDVVTSYTQGLMMSTSN